MRWNRTRDGRELGLPEVADGPDAHGEQRGEPGHRDRRHQVTRCVWHRRAGAEGEDREQRARWVPVLGQGQARCAGGHHAAQRHRDPGRVRQQGDRAARHDADDQRSAGRELHRSAGQVDVVAAVQRGERAERGIHRPLGPVDGGDDEQRHQHRDAGAQGDPVGAGVRPEVQQSEATTCWWRGHHTPLHGHGDPPDYPVRLRLRRAMGLPPLSLPGPAPRRSSGPAQCDDVRAQAPFTSARGLLAAAVGRCPRAISGESDSCVAA